MVTVQSISGYAQPSFVFQPSKGTVDLKPHFKILEDTINQFTDIEFLQKADRFELIKDFKPKGSTSVFWLITRFSSAEKAEASIHFKHLSYADLYFMADTPGAKPIHRQAGAFRPIENITDGDSRFDFSIKIDQNVPYIILIKSHHTKKYLPVFDFYLSERFTFLETKYKSELNDLWPQGASALLFLYIFLRWITTRHRPFIWLMLFVASFNLYGIALNRYLIDWFFPSMPHIGWLLPQHFLHFGLLGLYLLLLDSWDVKHKNIKLYQWGKALVCGLMLLTITVFISNYCFSNFELAGKITISFLLFLLVYSIVMLFKVWNKLSKQELYLAYGLILFFGVIIIGSLSVLIFQEMSYNIIPNLAKGISICIAFLFLMGLNGRLRQNELDNTNYLKELNTLQQHQNEILEESVKERTNELSQRNAHIETLMNEVNHRVKNNLQMLYSLNSLRLGGKEESEAGNILRDNISRIKAMMLVNENLQLSEDDQQLILKPFVNSIIDHSKRIFEAEKPVDIKVDIPEELTLDSKLALPLGLIVSELLVNSYKHAFRNVNAPKISIALNRSANSWKIVYSDNGNGLPKNVVPSFGTSLIQDLSRQINGKMQVLSDEGLTYIFTITSK
ncbi:histidine kinase dimerization/phosphoacceptor domain -containing protein [Pedobacter arcticus]|uniref:histidine kinase dimerization/phosphoacceptor domain -containing protein n=1 Tax=Pedobacter arcticus TaxID=752140 RepID=UPI0002E2C15A|nr:histidine kinase dimerization/phosphoacceptor domain -containing protein [Pedobacter arcticus]